MAGPAKINVEEVTLGYTISTGTDDSDFVDVRTSDDLAEGTVYYVICTAIVEGSDSSSLFEWRLYDETNEEVITDSTTIREMTQTAVPQTYYYVGQFTVGSTTGGLVFQQKGYPDVVDPPSLYRPARTNFLSMLLLDMSELHSKQYFFETQQDNSQVQATFSDRVSATVIQQNKNDTWLVFAWTMYYINNVAHSLISRIACDDEDTTDPSILFEGEDTEERLGWWWCRPFVLSGDNSTVEWKIEDKRETSGGGAHYCKRTTLFGIKLSSLPDYSAKHSTTDVSPVDDAYFPLKTTNFTPSITDKVIAVGCALAELGGSTRKGGMLIAENGTTIPNDVMDRENAINTNDATDILPLSYITMYDGVAASNSQMTFDVRSSHPATATEAVFSDSTLTLFGIRTDATTHVTYTAVAKQVYTSGDVASQTFDAGSKATQGFASGDVEGQGFASGDTAAQSHSGGDVEAEARP